LSSHRILSRLSAADLGLLEPHLEPVDLPIHRPLQSRNRRIDHVFSILASRVARERDVAGSCRQMLQMIHAALVALRATHACLQSIA
jgi:hypothetical protein